jgi:hypothetical protein
MNRSRIHRGLCSILAGGNICFGLLATLKPSSVAALMDETQDQVRAIGMRDLQAGISLMSGRRGLLPLLLGVRSDLAEALHWLRTKPRLAVFPAVWVVLGVAALLTRESTKAPA